MAAPQQRAVPNGAVVQKEVVVQQQVVPAEALHALHHLFSVLAKKNHVAPTKVKKSPSVFGDGQRDVTKVEKPKAPFGDGFKGKSTRKTNVPRLETLLVWSFEEANKHGSPCLAVSGLYMCPC